LKTLAQRTISGLVYLVIIVGSLFLGKYAYGIVFLLTTILALLEFYDINGISRANTATVVGISSAVVIFILSFLVTSGLAGSHLLALAFLLPVVVLIIALYTSDAVLGNNLAIIVLGVVYIAVPLAVMNYLVFPAVNEKVYTHRILLGIFTLIWINDTGAYVTGSLMGRHRLFPRISPKKSWEGLIGGTLLTLIAALWMNDIMGMLSQADWIILGTLVSVFGIYGDLSESWFKRKAQRKDSGSLIPGHGGMLDRIDSVLFVIPVSFIYLILHGL
jgi:phosphatidate cytidylyltransferase